MAEELKIAGKCVKQLAELADKHLTCDTAKWAVKDVAPGVRAGIAVSSRPNARGAAI
jgi:hypothetical protein